MIQYKKLNNILYLKDAIKILLIFSSRKKNLFLFFFLFPFMIIFAQGNLPYVDDKPYHFGFLVGLNTADFGIVHKDTLIDNKAYHVSVSTLQPGFSVGIITNLRLSKYWNLRFTPTLHFSERTLTYRADTSSITTSTNINSIPLCLPLYIKYSAERKDNYRPYLLGGGGIYYDFGRNKEKAILLKPTDYYVEFGVGCDLYFSFFKLAPELKFALGFNNILTPLKERDAGGLTEQDKLHNNVLSKLTSKMLTLCFNFE
mgnify:CR=1 FL=1